MKEKNPGESKVVSFEITPELMQVVNNNGMRVIERGEIKIHISGACPAQRSINIGAAQPVEGIFLYSGDPASEK